MNETLKELLEEFPELKEDSEKLEKVALYLENSKPNIEASIEFKEDLRKRLNTIIELKSGSKKSPWRIAIPVFGCLVVAFGVFVYFRDMPKIDDGIEGMQGPEIQNSYMLDEGDFMRTGGSDDSIQDNGSVNKISLEEEEDVIDDDADIQNLDTLDQEMPSVMSMPSTDIGVDNAQVEESVGTSLDNIIEDSNGMFDAVPNTGGEVMQITATNEDAIISDTQLDAEVNDVMNLLDELFKGISEEGTVSGGTGGANIDNGNVNSFDEEISFKDFCIGEGGFYITTGKGYVCRKSGEECKEENYINGQCEFEPIN